MMMMTMMMMTRSKRKSVSLGWGEENRKRSEAYNREDYFGIIFTQGWEGGRG
jgi:hypothetical protein